MSASASTTRPSEPSSQRTTGSTVLLVLAGVIAAVLAALVVARIGIALGAPSDAMQLQLPAYAVFTFVGVVVGAIGWSVVRRRAARPAAVLRWLVPVTLAVLFVPDILLGLSGQPWSTVVTLMVMHVAVAAVAVVTYLRAMPLD